MSNQKSQFDPSLSPSESIAKAEADINSYGAKTGHKTQSDSTLESGVNENVEADFPGANVQVGGTRRGDNPAIPDEEGGEINKSTGRQTRADEFEGPGGPEDKVRLAENDRRGDDDVTGTTRQQQF